MSFCTSHGGGVTRCHYKKEMMIDVKVDALLSNVCHEKSMNRQKLVKGEGGLVDERHLEQQWLGAMLFLIAFQGVDIWKRQL